MKKLTILLVCISVATVNSCARKMTTDEFNNYRVKVFEAYCTNDVDAAENALLDGLKTLSKLEKDGIERIDFDAVKATFHDGLFLIYRRTHQTNKMVFEFEQIVDCLARSSRSRGLPPPPSITYDELANAIERVERNANVRWKTNIVVQQNGNP